MHALIFHVGRCNASVIRYFDTACYAIELARHDETNPTVGIDGAWIHRGMTRDFLNDAPSVVSIS